MLSSFSSSHSSLSSGHYALSGIITPKDPDPNFHNKNYNNKLKTITRIARNKHQDSGALPGIITPRDPDPDFHNKNYNGKLKTITRITTNKHQDSGALSGNITPKDPDHGHKSGQFPRGGQVSYID